MIHMSLGANQEKKNVKHGENVHTVAQKCWAELQSQLSCPLELQLFLQNQVSQSKNWRALPPPVGRAGG